LPYIKKRKFTARRKPLIRSPRFQLPKGTHIDYKNITLIQKYVSDRGKIIARRITGLTAKQQRELTISIKHARFLALLSAGGVKK